MRDFFQGQTIMSVKFVYEPDGRPSGLVSNHAHSLGHGLSPRAPDELNHPLQAFAEFESKDEALKVGP